MKILGGAGVKPSCAFILTSGSRKPYLDKRQPRRVHGQEVEYEAAFRMGSQPGAHFGGPMRADGVQDHVDGLARWRLLVEYGEEFAELARAVLETHHAAHLAVIDAKAG